MSYKFNPNKELAKYRFSIKVESSKVDASLGMEHIENDIIWSKCLDHNNPEIPALIIKAIDDYRERAIEFFKGYWSVPYQLDSDSIDR